MSDARRNLVTADISSPAASEAASSLLSRLYSGLLLRLPLDGSQAMTGDLDMGGNDITNLGTSLGSVTDLLSTKYTATTTSVTTTLTTISWPTPGLNQGSFTYSAGVFTVPSGLNGAYLEFNVNAGFLVGVPTGTDRSELIIELQKDTGGGYTTMAVARNYTTRSGNLDQGGVSLSFIDPTAAATSDNWRVQIATATGSVAGTIDAPQTFMSIKAYS